MQVKGTKKEEKNRHEKYEKGILSCPKIKEELKKIENNFAVDSFCPFSFFYSKNFFFIKVPI